MNKKQFKRRRIYEFYLKALRAISPDQINFVLCPLCLNRYSDIDDFSLEHIPPDSQGGKDILITCEECNSIAGRTIDSDLFKQDLSKNYYSKLDEPRKIQFDMSGLKLNSSIQHISGSRFNIEIPIQNNNPKNLEAFKDVADYYNKNKNWYECKFTINKKITYNPFRADISNLKSAYLIAFAQFGYRYIFRESLEIVRTQIKNNTTRIINRFCAESIDNISGNSIIILEKPFKSLVIQFNSKYIFLPFWESENNFYAFLSNYNEDVISLTGASHPLPKRTEFIFDFVKV